MHKRKRLFYVVFVCLLLLSFYATGGLRSARLPFGVIILVHREDYWHELCHDIRIKKYGNELKWYWKWATDKQFFCAEELSCGGYYVQCLGG